MAIARGEVSSSLVTFPLRPGQVRSAQQLRTAQQQLLEAALESGDLGSLVERVAELVGSTVVLQDRYLAVVASACGPAGAAPTSDVMLDRRCPMVRELVRGGGPGNPVVELPRRASSPPRLVVPLVAGSEAFAFLVAVAAGSETLATLEAAAPLLAVSLRAEERLCQVLARDQREFFLDLLAQRSPGCLVLQGRRLGHDLEQPHWPIVFALPEGSADKLEELVREVTREDRDAVLPVVGRDGEAVVVFLPALADGVLAAGDLARRVLARSHERGLRPKAGWGPRCERLDQYADGVARARWVVDVLPVLGSDPDLAGFESLGIYALLYEKRDKDQLWEFARRWLGTLLDHDAIHAPTTGRAELARTLRVLLEAGGPSAAAAHLYVHISTLKYRIRKIESILGVDLGDPEVCFNVRLAFKILDVHERMAAGGRA